MHGAQWTGRFERTRGKMELAGNRSEAGQRDELLAGVKRLTRIVLDRLEQGSKEGTLDQAQMRMLGSIALRSYKLWLEALGPGTNRKVWELIKAENGLAGKLAGTMREAEQE